MVAKYGEAVVQELESDNRIHRWTIEELEAKGTSSRSSLRGSHLFQQCLE
ncbi:hypothetical protein [uncultured Klebsiella sp.]